MSMRTHKTNPDMVVQLRNAIRSPGVDTRMWVSLAVVTSAVQVDAEEGLFVDVTLMPSGLEETARIGAIYAGNGFGLYVPLEIDDEVLVAVPGGDFDSTCWIIGRSWSRADPPAAEFAESGAAVADLILLAKTDASVKIAVQGSGNLSLEARGDGKIQLSSGAGNTLQPGVLGNDLQTQLNDMKVKFDGHTHIYNPGALAPIATASPVVSFNGGEVRATKYEGE